MEKLKPASFFDLHGLEMAGLFEGIDPVWEALDRIKDFILQIIRPNAAVLRRHGEMVRQNAVLWQGQAFTENLDIRIDDPTKGRMEVLAEGRRLDGASVIYAGSFFMDDDVEIGPGVVVEPGALIKGPSIIGPGTEVRQGAYVRGSCLVGRSCVVGHATELKNAVMMDGAKAGHFAYVGDSILGREVNLGAGTKLANLKILAGPIKVRMDNRVIKVDRRKFGAVMGDGVETGCNSVTSPGTVLARRCLVVPNMTVATGYYPERSVLRPR
jgi:bifunctional N-acetylglucosamine-1-phosphate-uridyltransferase/glucosamine-1-phosphate-acetyltransferase GlmU-like protein